MSSPASSSRSPAKSPAKRVHWQFDDDSMAVDEMPLFASNTNTGSSSSPNLARHNGSTARNLPYTPALPVNGASLAYPSPPEHWQDRHARTPSASTVTPTVELMSLLTYGLGAERTRLYYDARFPPATAYKGKVAAYRALEPTDRNRLATQPPVPRMRLICKDLAWPIIVENPKGITFDDVLNAIHKTLSLNVEEGEYFLAPPETREKLLNHYKENSKGDAAKHALRAREDGIKRVDLLGHKTMFAGFSKPSDSDALLSERVRDPKQKQETWVIHFKEAKP